MKKISIDQLIMALLVVNLVLSILNLVIRRAGQGKRGRIRLRNK